MPGVIDFYVYKFNIMFVGIRVADNVREKKSTCFILL